MSHPEGLSSMRTTLPSISLKSLRVYGGGASVRLVPLRFGQALVVEVLVEPFALTEVPRRQLRESVVCGGPVEFQYVKVFAFTIGGPPDEGELW